jgi:hypothetical protein
MSVPRLAPAMLGTRLRRRLAVPDRLGLDVPIGQRVEERSAGIGRNPNAAVEHLHGDPLGADQVEHFAPHIAGRPDDGDVVTDR